MTPPARPASSVVIAAYQAESTLAETLASILPRLGPDDEVLVCDDGSTDGTVAIAEAAGDSRVRVLSGEHSGAPSTPRNRGIAAARGDVIFFVDADDVALDDKFAASHAALAAHPDAAMVCTDFQRIDARGSILEARVLADYELARDSIDGGVYCVDSERATRLLARENFVGTSSVGIRREVLATTGGFDPALPNSEDRDLWFRIARRHAIVFVNRALHGYRLHDGNITSRPHQRTAAYRVDVLLREARTPLDAAHARDLRTTAASVLDAVAYEAFVHGDMSACRRASARALGLQPAGHRVRRVLLSLLGRRLVGWLRRRRALSASHGPDLTRGE